MLFYLSICDLRINEYNNISIAVSAIVILFIIGFAPYQLHMIIMGIPYNMTVHKECGPTPLFVSRFCNTRESKNENQPTPIWHIRMPSTQKRGGIDIRYRKSGSQSFQHLHSRVCRFTDGQKRCCSPYVAACFHKRRCKYKKNF